MSDLARVMYSGVMYTTLKSPLRKQKGNIPHREYKGGAVNDESSWKGWGGGL